MWVVIVPVQVTELIFPRRRALPWLHLRGLIVCCVVFLLGSRIAWYGWTQQARARLGATPYHPPLPYIASGLAAIVVLIALAYLLRNMGQPVAEGRTAPAWLAGLTAFTMGAAWFLLIGQIFVSRPWGPPNQALFLGLVWAVLALILFTWWTGRRAWSQMHRFLACWGATLACQAMPYITIATWPKIDIIGKAIFDAAALAGFLWLGTKVLARQKAGPDAI